jgi:BirA family biotin operon repressor/biotin-[acetyl-CoA-carboxylase] ligase
MTSPWSDLERPPLSALRLGAAVSDGPVWTQVRVVASTGSTNADVAARARAGDGEGLVVIAEHQTAGRGRLDRAWTAPPRSSLILSALLKPVTDAATWPLLPLLTGIAVVETLRAVGRVHPQLKWPNDVMIGDRKVGGILAERVDGAVVIGVGINVSLSEDELPVPTATSLALSGGSTNREILAKELLRALGRRYVAWRDTQGSGASVLGIYRELCGTIGREVSVQLPGGDVVTGMVESVDDEGRLVVRTGDTVSALSAGDVVHVRRKA